MKTYLKALGFLSAALLVTGCATSTTNLVVSVDQIEHSESKATAQLVEVFVDDGRSLETGRSERESLGVSMGTISFNPSETVLIKRALEPELADLLEKRGYQSPQFYLVELTEFRVTTESTPIYWDVLGRIKARLKLRNQALDLFGTHTERTYVWPGEEVVGKVVQKSLAQVRAELKTALQALPSDELAGFQKRPTDWAELKAEQERTAELGLPVGMELPDKEALLYLYRPSQFIGSGGAYEIAINDKHVTNMLDGGRFPYICKPGEAQIQAKVAPNLFNIGLGLALASKSKLDVTLEPGEIHFIEVKVGSTGPKLVSVSRDEGLAGIKNTKLMKTIEK